MKIYILEKESKSSGCIRQWLAEIKAVDVIESYDDHKAFIRRVMENPPDSCLIRIGNSNIPGLGTAATVQKLNEKIKIILIADNLDYAVDAFEIGVYGYLLSPVDKVKLQNLFL